MSQSALTVTELTIKQKGETILENVTFTINPGEIVYLLGHNGSGKSTLVRTLLGLSSYQSGTITIFGEALNQDKVSHLCGYLPQQSFFDKEFPITVGEMIQLECRVHKACSIGVKGHLSQLGGEYLTDRMIHNLSGGELQKVLISRAFVTDPQIIFLDEPTNNLDKESENNFFQLLDTLNKKEGKTIILITHDHNIIQKKSDKVLFIKEKKVLCGQAEKILTSYLESYEPL